MNKLATFGAGCFWCIEDDFAKVKGVEQTRVGYMGGHIEWPTYQQVCSGMTGHAEVVQVTYDSKQLAYDTLLDEFFAIHNPTTLNQQGPDIGTQYRSVVFYHDEAQKKKALDKIAVLNQSSRFQNPIVTEVSPAQTFWDAEEYHQKYNEKMRNSV